MNRVFHVLCLTLLTSLVSVASSAGERNRDHAQHDQANYTQSNGVKTRNKQHFSRYHRSQNKPSTAHFHKGHKHQKNKKHKHRKKHGCSATQDYTLSVLLEGAGSGRVSSSPAGVYCETDCSEDYAGNTQVVLSAQAYTGSVFTGWSGGGCGGTAACSITLNADSTVTANFMLVEPPALSLVTPYVNESDMTEIRSIFNAQYNPDPWGWIHDGLDIYPAENLKPFQAACAGQVNTIYTFDEQVTLFIRCDANYTIEYNFEAQAPNTGQIQLDNILVTEGQQVAQGEVIGYLYSAANPASAHVHFALYENAVPICPVPHFTQTAFDSVQNLVLQANPDLLICMSGDVSPPALITPYYSEADMAKIATGYSAEGSYSPWNYVNRGLNIYPQGDLKQFQAACSGTIDKIELQQESVDGNWQAEVAVVCNEYVGDPNNGGYFIPLTTKYFFNTMTTDPAIAQQQLDNIVVTLGQSVTQGDTLGYLKAVNEDAHVHFALWQFSRAEFEQIYGISGIPLCPQAHFTSQANDSILNLLYVVWPTAGMCYE